MQPYSNHITQTVQHQPSLNWMCYGSLLFLLLYPSLSIGQPIWGGAGFLFGGPSVWPGSANAIHQVSNTVGPSSEGYLLLGAEAYFRRNRWLVGVNMSALSNKRIQNGATLSTIESSASNAHIWVGWVAWSNKRAKVYPSLGPGLTSFNINSTTPNNELTTSTLNGFSTDIGLTFDWFVLRSSDTPTLSAGPMLSIRAGYRLTTSSAEWHGIANGVTTLAPTRYSPTGFYVTLGIGGGGFQSK